MFNLESQRSKKLGGIKNGQKEQKNCSEFLQAGNQ